MIVLVDKIVYIICLNPLITWIQLDFKIFVINNLLKYLSICHLFDSRLKHYLSIYHLFDISSQRLFKIKINEEM